MLLIALAVVWLVSIVIVGVFWWDSARDAAAPVVEAVEAVKADVAAAVAPTAEPDAS